MQKGTGLLLQRRVGNSAGISLFLNVVRLAHQLLPSVSSRDPFSGGGGM